MRRCSIVIAPANRTWKDTDQLLFEKAEKLSGRTPVVLCLNCAGRDVVQTFTGLMPPLQPSSQAGVSDQPVRIHGRQINCGTSWNTTAA